MSENINNNDHVDESVINKYIDTYNKVSSKSSFIKDESNVETMFSVIDYFLAQLGYKKDEINSLYIEPPKKEITEETNVNLSSIKEIKIAQLNKLFGEKFIKHSADFERFLRCLINLFDYSIENILLISYQYPETPILLKEETEWRNSGFSIKKGALPINISKFENNKFVLNKKYDIRQTNTPIYDYPKELRCSENVFYKCVLGSISNKIGLKVVGDNSVPIEYDELTNNIIYSSKRENGVKIIAYMLKVIVLINLSESIYYFDKETRELVAEIIASYVAKKFGFEYDFTVPRVSNSKISIRMQAYLNEINIPCTFNDKLQVKNKDLFNVLSVIKDESKTMVVFLNKYLPYFIQKEEKND